MAKAPCPHSPGYSLLEMLVVISLLAAVAFISTGNYRNVIEDSGERLVLTEMQEIAGAIRRFKQDTGYFPREGPFAHGTVAGQSVTDVNLSGVNHAGATATARQEWFESPANFYQLLVAPLLSGHPAGLEQWNNETGRGWRGPYLQGVRDGYVDIGDDPDDPTNIVTRGIPDVDGIADPFLAGDRAGGGAEVDGRILDWARNHRPVNAGDPPREEREHWGRPYLFLQLGTPLKWSLVSMGPDGEYDNGGDDDIVLPLE